MPGWGGRWWGGTEYFGWRCSFGLVLLVLSVLLPGRLLMLAYETTFFLSSLLFALHLDFLFSLFSLLSSLQTYQISFIFLSVEPMQTMHPFLVILTLLWPVFGQVPTLSAVTAPLPLVTQSAS